MPLAEQTDTVMIESYGTYQRGGEPMKRNDGSPVEYVEFRVDGEERARRETLDRAVNGNRAAVGRRVELVLESRQEPQARRGANGDYVVYAVKRRVLGFLDPPEVKA